MNFASMDYFIMVAREKSFTKAAQRLYITQQTLSAHIASIEKELGCALFVRHVPLELTYAGQVFLKYALDFQKRHRSMEQEFNDIAHRQQGRLRIGIAYTRGHALMPQLITEFQRQYPRMQVHLLEASNNTLHKMLLDGELDLAIAYFPENITGLELVDFYQEEIVLLAARSLLDEIYGDKADELIRQVRESGDVSLLSECPFLLNGLNDVAGQLSRRLFDAVGLNPTVRAQSKNIETLLGLCVRGVGATFSPDTLLQTALPPEQLKGLEVFHLSGSSSYNICFGYRSQTYQWSMIQSFIQIARAMWGDLGKQPQA